MHYCKIKVQVRNDELAQAIRCVFGHKMSLQKGPKTLTIRDNMLPFENADPYSLDRNLIVFSNDVLVARCGDEQRKWTDEVHNARDEWLTRWAESAPERPIRCPSEC